MITIMHTAKVPPTTPVIIGATGDESDELDVEDGNSVISDTTKGLLHCPSVNVVTALTFKQLHDTIHMYVIREDNMYLDKWLGSLPMYVVHRGNRVIHLCMHIYVINDIYFHSNTCEMWYMVHNH